MKFFATLILLSLVVSFSACSKENSMPEETPSMAFDENIAQTSSEETELAEETELTVSETESAATEIEFTYTELVTDKNTYILIEGYEPPISKGIFELPVPEFLTEEQQNLYRRAKVLYHILRRSPTLIDEAFPPKDETNSILEHSGPYTVWVDETELRFCPAYGRYKLWEDFEKMGLSIFIESYFEELSLYTVFEICNYTFYIDADVGSKGGYFPQYAPDTFELISQTETQIDFDIIGHYFNTLQPTEDDIPYEIHYPVQMVLTENGWRFSLFNIAS